MANGKPEKVASLDLGKLQSMQDPITVRLARKQAGDLEEPIFIPARDPDTGEQDWNGTPGMNWRKDDVAKLETWTKEYQGGGIYVATALDANQTEMKWKFGHPGPPKTPVQGMNGAMIPAPAVVPQQAAPPQRPMQPPFGAQASFLGQQPGFPQQPQQPPQQQQPQQQPQQAQQPQWVPPPAPQVVYPPPPVPQFQFSPQRRFLGGDPLGFDQFGQAPWGGGGWPQQPPQWGQGPSGMPPWYPPPPAPVVAAPPAPVRDLEAEARLKRMEDELAESKRREADARDRETALKHQQEIDRKDAAHQAELAATRDEMRQIKDAIAAKQNEPKEDAETRQLRQENERLRLAQQQAAVESQNKAISDLAASQNKAVADLAAMVKQLAEGGGHKVSAESDRIRELERKHEQDRENDRREREKLEAERKRDLDRMEAERTREREKQEAKEREERLRQDMKEAAAKTEQMMRDMKEAATAAAAAAAANKGPDPMFELMRAMSAEAAEAQKEVARQNAATAQIHATQAQVQATTMQSLLMSPVQVMAAMKESGANTSGYMKEMIQSTLGVVELYKDAAHAAREASSGGSASATAEIVQQAVGGLSRVAQQFMASREGVAAANAQTAASQAQAVQAQAAAAIAQVNAVQQHQPQQQPQRLQAVPAGAGLGGAPPLATNFRQQVPGVQCGQCGTMYAAADPVCANPNCRAPNQLHAQQPQQPQYVVDAATGALRFVAQQAAQPAAQAMPAVPPPPQPVVAAATTGKVIPISPERPSDQALFGMTLPAVYNLRKWVTDGTHDPGQIVDKMLEGVDYVKKNGLRVPAFELFENERWADFVDALIPAAPEEFKIEVVRILSTCLEDDEEEGKNASGPSEDPPAAS